MLKPLIVLLDIGSGEHRKLSNISDIADDFGEEYCSTLLGYYIFTGEDTTSAFRGKGKVNPLKKLQKKPRFHSTFKALGNEWQLTDKIYDELEEFVCLMYGYPRHTKVNKARSLILKKMVGGDTDKIKKKTNVDLSKIPPCQNTFRPHVDRVNYKTCISKLSHIAKPHFQSSESNGCITDKDRILHPHWSYGPILPDRLVDILADIQDKSSDDEEEEKSDSDCYSSDGYDSSSEDEDSD